MSLRRRTPEEADAAWMARALELARRAAGETNPNPAVGCVLVRGGRVVGEGYHHRAGQPHAEVEALRAAGARARGASAFVTLEPCAHHGRTPPCSEALRAAGVARVAAAMLDPNPRVAGHGLRALQRAGIETSHGLLAAEAAALNEGFVSASLLGRPFVMLKAATTLDGRIATASGDSKWITSPAQRRAARRMRRDFDAIAVGIGTVLHDDPLLLPQPRTRRPYPRVVLDSNLRLPERSQLVQTAARAPVWVFCRQADPRKRRRLERLGVRVFEAPKGAERVPLRLVLDTLWREGLWSLMVEGGSELLGAFLQQRLLDKLVLFRAPLLLGGRDSLPAFGGASPRRIAGALRLQHTNPLLARYGPLPPLPHDPLLEVWYPERGR